MSVPVQNLGLKTQAFLLGILETIIWSLTLAVAGHRISNAIHQEKVDKAKAYAHLSGAKSDWDNGIRVIHHFEDSSYASVYVLLTLYLALSVVGIFMTISLLLGILKDNRSLVKGWVFVKSVVLILTVCLFTTNQILHSDFDVLNLLFILANVFGGVYLLWIGTKLLAEMKIGMRMVEENHLTPITEFPLQNIK